MNIDCQENNDTITSMSAAVREVIDAYPAGHQFFGNELKDDVVQIYPEALNMYPDTILRMARRHRRNSFKVVDQNNSLYEKTKVVSIDIIPKTISCPTLPLHCEKTLQMDLFVL